MKQLETAEAARDPANFLGLASLLPKDATGESPGRSEASLMNLPGCQQPPGKACSKEAAYARGAVHVVAASFFPRESSGRTLEGGLASSREEESRAAREPAARALFFTIG